MLAHQPVILNIIFACYLAALPCYLLHFFRHKSGWRVLAVSAMLTGFALQSALLAARWLEAGYLPVTNLFSTQYFFSWALVLTYLYFDVRYRVGSSGLFVVVINLLLLGSVLQRDPEIPILIPSLDTPLFTIHIICSFTGYAMFAMAFTLGVIYLINRYIPNKRLPDPVVLRKLNEEAIFLGFILFSICMIAGCIWAYIAWGFYFSWEIKSLWSFIVWLFYAGMCHAKFIRRWQGTGYAWLSLLGFGVVLFTYLGIGLLLESSHPLE